MSVTADCVLLSKTEAASRLGVSKWKLYRMIDEGLIPVVSTGPRDMIRADALYNFGLAGDKPVESAVLT